MDGGADANLHNTIRMGARVSDEPGNNDSHCRNGRTTSDRKLLSTWRRNASPPPKVGSSNTITADAPISV